MSRVEYDDVGSTFFGIGLGSSLLIPFTLHFLWTLYDLIDHEKYLGVKKRLGLELKPRTELERKQLDRIKSNSRSRAFRSKSLIIKITIIVLGWLFVGYLYSTTSENADIASFDPWEVLGISEGRVGDSQTEKRVKSAYRKLSLKYHPDRMINADTDAKASAQLIFEKVQTAHEILTSPERYKIYKQTGSPDGTSSLEVSIGLPKLLMSKRNHNVILVVYLLLLCIVVPIAVGSWYYRSTLYGEKLTLNDTYGIFALWLDAKLPLEHYPEVLALSAEFRHLPKRTKEETDLLDELQRTMQAEGCMAASLWKLTKKEKSMERWPACSRANVLIHAYLNRRTDNLTPGLKEDLLYILNTSQMLIPVMFDAVVYLRLLKPMKLVIKFEQCMTQALWIKNHAFEQLPHVTAADAERAKAVSESVKKLVLNTNATENQLLNSLNQEMNDNQKKDLSVAVDALPRVHLTTRIGCVSQQNKDGSFVFEEEACEGDLLTAEVTLNLRHMPGPVHAPFLPFFKKSVWVVLFTKKGDSRVLAHLKLKESVGMVRDKILMPTKNFLNVGKHQFDFHLFPLSYLGFDSLYTGSVDLKPESHIEPIVLHPEDQALDKQLSLLEEAFGKAEESDDSGFMDSDEEMDTKSAKKPIARKRASSSDRLFSSDEEEFCEEVEPEF